MTMERSLERPHVNFHEDFARYRQKSEAAKWCREFSGYWTFLELEMASMLERLKRSSFQ